jgi:hypothetical protein
MRPIYQTILTQGGCIGNAPVVIDSYQNPTNVTVQVDIKGTASGHLQVSYDDPFLTYSSSYSNANWVNASGAVTAAGAITIINFNSTHFRALRWTPHLTTSGAVYLTIIQAGQFG